MSECYVRLALKDNDLYFEMRMKQGLPDLNDIDFRSTPPPDGGSAAQCDANNLVMASETLPEERQFFGMGRAAGDLATTAVTEAVEQVLHRLKLENELKRTPANAAPGIINVLHPGRPAEQLVALLGGQAAVEERI